MEPLSETQKQRIAEAVRAACVRAAIEGYEQAGMDGLCAEGAWEAAVEAMRGLDLDRLLRQADEAHGDEAHNR